MATRMVTTPSYTPSGASSKRYYYLNGDWGISANTTTYCTLYISLTLGVNASVGSSDIYGRSYIGGVMRQNVKKAFEYKSSHPVLTFNLGTWSGNWDKGVAAYNVAVQGQIYKPSSNVSGTYTSGTWYITIPALSAQPAPHITLPENLYMDPVAITLDNYDTSIYTVHLSYNVAGLTGSISGLSWHVPEEVLDALVGAEVKTITVTASTVYNGSVIATKSDVVSVDAASLKVTIPVLSADTIAVGNALTITLTSSPGNEDPSHNITLLNSTGETVIETLFTGTSAASVVWYPKLNLVAGTYTLRVQSLEAGVDVGAIDLPINVTVNSNIIEIDENIEQLFTEGGNLFIQTTPENAKAFLYKEASKSYIYIGEPGEHTVEDLPTGEAKLKFFFLDAEGGATEIESIGYFKGTIQERS